MRYKELTKPVVYSGNLLLDGEFNPPPPPPGNVEALALHSWRSLYLDEVLVLMQIGFEVISLPGCCA